MDNLVILFAIIIIVLFVAVISNQYYSLKRMAAIERSLDELHRKLNEMKR